MSKKYPLATQRKRYHNSFIDDYVFKLTLAGVMLFTLAMRISLSEWMIFMIVASVLLVNEVILPYFTGRTIGMFLTKSQIVLPNGKKPTLKQIFIRELVSYIPFEGLTFLTSHHPIGLHDSLSKTVVVYTGNQAAIKDEGTSAIYPNLHKKNDRKRFLILMAILGVLTFFYILEVYVSTHN